MFSTLESLGRAKEAELNAAGPGSAAFFVCDVTDEKQVEVRTPSSVHCSLSRVLSSVRAHIFLYTRIGLRPIRRAALWTPRLPRQQRRMSCAVLSNFLLITNVELL